MRLERFEVASAARSEQNDFRSIHSLVIASQRVRPEAAGPMTSSAKQSSAAPPFWIASSLRSSQ
jgi:hypothetical protein